MVSFKIENGVLKIDDNYKTNIWLAIIICIISIFNAVVILIKKPIAEFDALNYLVLGTGFMVLIALIWFFYKKSIDKEVPLEQIKKLHSFSVMGSIRFSLHLKNGKKRDLPIDENQAKLLAELLESKKENYKKPR